LVVVVSDARSQAVEAAAHAAVGYIAENMFQAEPFRSAAMAEAAINAYLAAMPRPTPAEIARVICCPSGRCISPHDCYALDRSRSYPVHIHDAAVAVARLYEGDKD
jgi:hypothetical protein